MSELGLLERNAAGGIKAASKVDRVRTTAIPVAMMMILFFSVMSSAPQLLNSVIEEKMSRISEVLIGSITPSELMMGKLLGSAAVSLLLATIYTTGGTFMAWRYGYGDDDPRRATWPGCSRSSRSPSFMFGAIFITIGAACSDLKDAQGMMTPAMLMMMLPAMTWFSIINAPDSTVSVALSLLPDRDAVPDAAADRDPAWAAGLADRRRVRPDRGHRRRLRARGGQDLPHRAC